jgi:hypothetical protein
LCIPVTEELADVDEAYMQTGADGSPEICIWQHPAGTVPEGKKFSEVVSCDKARTLGPSWYIPPSLKVESSVSRLEDESFRTELEWLRGQVGSSACSCCHSSEISGYASYFDIDAPGVWTDMLSMTAVVMAAGLADDHKYLGYLPPETNFGFDRELTMFATTDIPRMQAYFMAEFERRGGTDADIETAREQFRQINNTLFTPAVECGPGEGLDAEGRLVWKGGSVRQVYIQEVGSENPGAPPNMDRPEGTLWALYADEGQPNFESGTIIPGVIPAGGVQRTPEDDTVAPVFEDGKKYRLFVTPDLLVGMNANCNFTFGEAAEETEQTCESDNTVCASLSFPEDLVGQPEKLVVALYKSLPPLGPPDVFPPYMVDNPEIPAGGTMEVKLDAPVTGDYLVYAVLYMEGGGAASWQPLAGVDYVAQSAALTLDGSGFTLPSVLGMSLAE